MPTEDPQDSLARLARIETDLDGCMQADRVRLGRRARELKRRPKGKRSSNWQRDLDRILERVERSKKLHRRRVDTRLAIEYPKELPITTRVEEIARMIREHPVTVIVGETGSGKTTQIPKICLAAGRGRQAKIGCTQPRRVAAQSLSRRLAEELDVQWGAEVGCKIRFRDRTVPETLVKMMTDGILLAEIRSDPDLLEYDTIIVDEAHERSLNIDFILGYLRLLVKRRPDLKVIITSATIDVARFSQAFDNAPVVEVSGRLFSVEVRYWPLEELLEEEGSSEDLSYVDGAVRAVQNLLGESDSGDLLVFLPSERDIREAVDLLPARLAAERGLSASRLEVLPLFGRLTAAEQQRVFSPGTKRRVVLATNIAETSLTIPGIRYVVDTGLARINRYNPRTHTQRLPIEPVSQASAAQRQGRCGRLRDGICVRLYSEADLISRPEHTPPEIQRSDLADVILRMQDLGLGAIDDFPFLDPPKPPAIRSGYQQLQELGALDDGRRLTPLGRDMARLPIAPAVSRMLLQAREENAVSQVLIIAAAISIQDPRERPLDRQEEADRQHRQFRHAHSDFLSLLKIWDSYHERFERLPTQSQMRKFCRQHFLSFTRMREWRDIHAQISESLREVGKRRQDGAIDVKAGRGGYDAIHRSIVTGLVGNLARKKERNLYQALRGKEPMLFPGSGLFERAADPSTGGSSPRWIVAAEMVETSRLFARTVARIDPDWLEELVGHLCRSTYRDPAWYPDAGRVLVREVVRLHGLELNSRLVPYGRVDAVAATELFIREALIADGIPEENGFHARHAFLSHNRQLRERLEAWQACRRQHDDLDLDQAAFDFYRDRFRDSETHDSICSLQDVDRLIKNRPGRFLFMSESDLLGERGVEFDRQAFPDALELGDEQLSLSYAYRPGQEDDGVTVKVPYKLIHAVRPEVLEWLVPGLREEKVTCLLRSLPKTIRKQLVPIPQTAKAIAADMKPTHPSFLESLEEFLAERYGIQIRRSDWGDATDLPQHLKMRVEVSGQAGESLLAGRDVSEIAERLEDQSRARPESEVWNRAAAEWHRDGVEHWDIGNLPEQVEISGAEGIPHLGYPGLELETSIGVRLFKTRAQAERHSRKALIRLHELSSKTELAWMRRGLRDGRRFADWYCADSHSADAGGVHIHGDTVFEMDAYEHLLEHLYGRSEVLPLTLTRFEEEESRGLKNMTGLAERFLRLASAVLENKRKVLSCPHPYPEMRVDVERLVPERFLLQVPLERLVDLSRYLQAVLIRADRARSDAVRDAQKAQLVRPYAESLVRFLSAPPEPGSVREGRLEGLRWLVEEWRVSVFAQELGTSQPVSTTRLDRQLEEVERSD